MTPQDRLAAALRLNSFSPDAAARGALAADPTIAADMELGRRIRDANDPLLISAIASADTVRYTASHDFVDALRAALTEGDTEFALRNTTAIDTDLGMTEGEKKGSGLNIPRVGEVNTEDYP